jgi:hypothetical protein
VDKLTGIIQGMKERELGKLEDQEFEAGTQIMDEIRRYLNSLGKEFTLESEGDAMV